jgi:hypothetical protein
MLQSSMTSWFAVSSLKFPSTGGMCIIKRTYTSHLPLSQTALKLSLCSRCNVSSPLCSVLKLGGISFLLWWTVTCIELLWCKSLKSFCELQYFSMNFCAQLLQISEPIPIWFHVTSMLARFPFPKVHAHVMSVTITKSIHFRQNLFMFLGMQC